MTIGVMLAVIAPPAWAAPGAPQDPARRAAEAIEKALQRHAPEVHRCFERALADSLDIAGDVEIEVDVGREGKVVGAKMIPKPGLAPTSDLAVCVETAARGFVLTGIEEGAAVVLPFTFQGQSDQFAVKAADVPERGPRPPGKRAGPPPPFSVKVLLDPVNVRTPKASLTLLTIAPKSRVAMHRHPRSAKALYLISGRGRVLGPSGAPPLTLEPGSVVYVPPGQPHVIETIGQKEPAVFLQAFSPPGPEQVYRDPTSVEARADFDVVRQAAAAAPGPVPVLTTAAAAKPVPWLDASGTPIAGALARVLIDGKSTPNPADRPQLSLSVIDLAATSQVPRHAHADSSEVLFVLAGGGTLQVGSEATPFGPDTALYLPAGQPHALKMQPGVTTRVVQILAPPGPNSPAGGPAKAEVR